MEDHPGATFPLTLGEGATLEQKTQLALFLVSNLSTHPRGREPGIE